VVSIQEMRDDRRDQNGHDKKNASQVG
jgi:hypothetical protein